MTLTIATSLPAAPFVAAASPPQTGSDAAPQTVPSVGSQDATITLDGYVAISAEEIIGASSAQLNLVELSSRSDKVQWPFPLPVELSDDYGPRVAPCDGCSTFHKGLDMIPGEGTPVAAVVSGVVRETGDSDSGFGVYAVIDHVVDGELVSTLYAHMQAGSLSVSPGQLVDSGQLLGKVGSTGQSTGPHLHLEIWSEGSDPIDPYQWLSERAGS